MAWRSSGSTNDEMVDKLKRYGIISSPCVEQGFRNVDRKHFVPHAIEDLAHADQPLREGFIHLSAPHIYGTAVEALELHENAPLSFLNIGSGTGYLNCIVASILGHTSTNYGVEAQLDVIQHCHTSVEKWKQNFTGKLPPFNVLHGSAYNISTDKGEALFRFDRIYVGAAIEKHSLSLFTDLLKDGGILVAPVDDEFIKVVRNVRPLHSIYAEKEFSQQVLSGVRFTSLTQVSTSPIILPSRVWSPSTHQLYPASFHESMITLLLCAQVSYQQSSSLINLASSLPRVLWLEIFSFMHQSWFDPAPSRESWLRQRLLEEQEKARNAEKERNELQAKLHRIDHERSMYRLMARKWQSRFQALVMRRRFNQQQNSNSNETDDVELNDDSSPGFSHNSDLWDVNDDIDTEDLDSQGDDDYQWSDSSEENQDSFSSSEIPDLEESETAMSVSPTESNSALSRMQVRTVSISDDE